MIVITGASDGLGAALAELFAADGKTVVNISRTENPKAKNVLTDLRDSAAIGQAAEAVLAMNEPLEALINCAGVLSVEELAKISTSEVEKVLAVNVAAPILLTSNLMDRLKRDGGDVVNVSSSVGTKGYKDQAAYGASKWALRGFSVNLQIELKNTPCRVISFCPGGFKTKLFEKATGVDNTQDGSQWMKAEEVARCLKQLLELPKSMEVSEIIVNRKAA